MIIHGDSSIELKKIESDSVDLIVTDPPYGYSFMGKNWDKAVPSVEIWKDCLRVLKPGAFAFVMSAPRQDVLSQMISRITAAGFDTDYTSIYWTYASGFPKAMNIGKMVDKRLGATREVIGDKPNYHPVKKDLTANTFSDYSKSGVEGIDYRITETGTMMMLDTAPATPEAKALDGSYGGFQPKPAVEVIIVAMKPLSENTYVDQALKNRKGITWLDDARIPTTETYETKGASKMMEDRPWNERENTFVSKSHEQGRFPANLLVSDDVLNDGVERKSGGNINVKRKGSKTNGIYGTYSDNDSLSEQLPSSGSYSRYFDLDKWANTLPFLITPKASKSEKNKGLESFPDKLAAGLPMRSSDGERGGEAEDGSSTDRVVLTKNFHPTVKPLKLMSYLITLGSREGDVVLDPFAGSCTTCLAAKELNRNYIGIEQEGEYVKICEARLQVNTLKT